MRVVRGCAAVERVSRRTRENNNFNTFFSRQPRGADMHGFKQAALTAVAVRSGNKATRVAQRRRLGSA